MYKTILVPVDLADTDLAKPAIETAVDDGQERRAASCGWSTCCR